MNGEAVCFQITYEQSWREVDRALRSITKRRSTLDVEEARWLREAEELEIWRPLGMVNALDYMERALGYSPHAGRERLRVARALGELPAIEAAMQRGELAFSAVRELTRVITEDTELAWLAAVRGKSLRQIEEMVGGHRAGDLPDDPADPAARRYVVRFEVSAATYARLREARTVLADEHARSLDDDAFIAALADGVLDGTPDTAATARPRHQLAVTLCSRCKQGWQNGGGMRIAIDPATVERIECDAQHIGSLDASVPERAHGEIPPATRRLVLHRDGGRCRVPGCRSARGIDVHHLKRRVDGGTHEPSNLVALCSACHQAHHDGRLHISGTADAIDVRRVGPGLEPEMSHVGHRHGAQRFADQVTRTDAKSALMRLGWKPSIATSAVDAALAELDASTPVERVIFEALRRCPRPTG